VYLPYPGNLLTIRFSEDLRPEAISRQPIACISLFNTMIESGITMPGAEMPEEAEAEVDA
jgi:hypothetical protein